MLIETVTIGASQRPDADLARADTLLAEVLARNRNDVRLHFALGFLRRVQGRINDARIELETTLSMDPNAVGAMLQLGFTLISLGKPDEALPYFEKALRLSPGDQNIYFFYSGLGYCQMLLGHLDDSIDNLRKARAANANFFYTPLYLAAAYGLRGDTSEAAGALADMIKINPKLISLAAVHQTHLCYRSPKCAALFARTIDVGLHKAGLPDD